MSIKDVSGKGENVMKKGIFVLSMILVAVLIAGCVGKGPVSLDLDKTSVTVNKNNNNTSEFITATITRNDNDNRDASFVLKFPEEKNSVYPVDSSGSRIKELRTRALKGENSKDTRQFKIYGNKGEADKSDFNLKIELWWDNNTKIADQDKILTITVE